MLVEVAIQGLHELAGYEDGLAYALVLKETNGSRRCFMMFDSDSVRFIRAATIHQHLEGKPLAHGACLDLLSLAGLQLHHVVIPGIRNEFFVTELHFSARQPQCHEGADARRCVGDGGTCTVLHPHGK